MRHAKSDVLDSKNHFFHRRMPPPGKRAGLCSLALPGLGLQFGQPLRSLLYIGRKVSELMHLAYLDRFVVGPGAALGPFNRLIAGFELHLSDFERLSRRVGCDLADGTRTTCLNASVSFGF